MEIHSFVFRCIGAGAYLGPITEWSVSEQLILASAVQRSGDQNWYRINYIFPIEVQFSDAFASPGFQ